MSKINTPAKILVIKRDALGDVISVTPFLEVLRRTFPDSIISYLVGSWSQKVLHNNPDINEIIVIDSQTWQNPVKKYFTQNKLSRQLQPRHFDTVFILQGPAPFHFWEKFSSRLGARNRTGFRKHGDKTTLTHSVELPAHQCHLFRVLKKNRAEHYLDLLRAIGVTDTNNRGNKLYPSATDQVWADEFWRKNHLTNRSVIAIAPGGAVNPGMKQLSKRWPSQRYSQVIAALTEKCDARIIILGGPSDQRVADEINRTLSGKTRQAVFSTVGRTTIHQTAELIARSKLFIGNDSGTLHIASTTQTPIIGIYGPTNPVVDGPYKSLGKILFHQTPFSPCYTHDCAGHFPCIKNVTVDEVLLSADQFLELSK